MFSHFAILLALSILLAGRVCGLSSVPPRTRAKLSNEVRSGNMNAPTLSRRDALISGATAAAATAAAVFAPSQARADAVTFPIEGSPERQSLLNAIASGSSDAILVDLIAQLEPLDPSKGNGAAAPEIGGTWELIYSVNAEAFSPLLTLPKPIRPTSLQLLGDDAAREVGDRRVAQVLNFPFVPLSLLLSSGAVPVEDKLTTLEIFPPFRLEVVWGDDSLRKAGRFAQGGKGGSRVQMVESGSDADFRSLNARDEEAQAAGRNMYKQRYLEVTGQPGDLRISEVVAGDPVIVGALFVHRRL
mmetsp:Transcript_32308/g.96890  ORF Transcript_32308/g.96890 Transcript_32308/m.96890 type:complete len:301 (-) Transcript_32308:114-1016(-)|eukprot:CAMPEP_0113556438 /NCGR_PEP_ID=MMETSP0015_2-20120614/17256_1 /TAXON_ID=2838 /ORGANISM="Odontella" /LENGTH=300 /DNA_ID=CAMNT_0000457793 /DNA_START=225 /DNA_END=1127 /DNA_ORIENTATION=- /assembly_acc=CAM_ASM_000160